MESTATKIKNRHDAAQLRALWKQQKQRVVFTNGCFDLLHLGHVDYLEKARQLGDKLIVALNTDQSVKRLKGETRPLQDEYARARIMASLQAVDMVILFDEETPQALISLIVPDILVKGSDYLTENIVGAEVVIKAGGVVQTIPFIDGYSTTNIIKKIKAQ